MVKHCICCNVDVEKIPDSRDGYVFFNIVQATTIIITLNGNKSAKRQSTSYVCDECISREKIRWNQLINTTWVDDIRLGEYND